MNKLSPYSMEPPRPLPMRLALPLTKPLLSWLILALNAFIWLLMTLGGGSTNPIVLIRFGAKVSWLVATGEYWRLFTAIFLHIGFLHLAFNSYALYSLGPQIESLYGRSRFLTIYLVGGLAGSAASYALSESLSAGASGAIFGLIGALAIYLIRHSDILGRRGKQALTNVVVVIFYNLVLSFAVPGIDVLGHLGGLLGGLSVAWFLCPDYRIALESNGLPLLVDDNNLKRQWRWLALAILLLVLCIGLGTLHWQGSIKI